MARVRVSRSRPIIPVFGAALPTLHTPNVGVTYYVDAVSGNDTWTGTTPAFTSGTTGPFQTLQKAFTNMRDNAAPWTAAGGNDLRVQVRAGTYQAASTATGTLDTDYNNAARRPSSSQWVIWEPYPGDATPVVKPPAGTTGAKYGIRTQVGTSNFQQFKGLKINGEQLVRGDGDVAGIYISGTGSNIEIADMEIFGMRANSVANGGTGARKAQGVYFDPSTTNCRLTRCRIYDIGGGTGTIANQEHGIYCSGNSIKMWNYLVYNIPNGYCTQIYSSDLTFDGILIANASLVGKGTVGKSCIIIHPNSTNCTLKNLLLYDPKEYGVELYPTAGGSGSNDIADQLMYYSPGVANKGTSSNGGTAWTAGWTASNEYTSDPLFTNVATDTYTLQSGSPAWDKGDNDYMASVLVDGTTRTRPSLGCY